MHVLCALRAVCLSASNHRTECGESQLLTATILDRLKITGELIIVIKSHSSSGANRSAIAEHNDRDMNAEQSVAATLVVRTRAFISVADRLFLASKPTLAVLNQVSGCPRNAPLEQWYNWPFREPKIATQTENQWRPIKRHRSWPFCLQYGKRCSLLPAFDATEIFCRP